MASGVFVEGLRPMVKGLQDMGVEVADLKEAFGEVGRIGAAAVERHTPVGPTGKLKASVRAAKRKNAAIVLAGNGRVTYAMIRNYGPGRNRQFLQKGEQDITDQVPGLIEAEITKLLESKGLA